jgi:hypothetical protein
MNVFKSLEDDGVNIEERLTKTECNTDGPSDRAFAEVKKEFTMIKTYLTKVYLLVQNFKGNGLVSLLQELKDRKTKIENDIDTMLNLHVDEPGFEKPFDQLVTDFTQFRLFCKESFFPEIQDELTKEDLQHVEEQLDQVA